MNKSGIKIGIIGGSGKMGQWFKRFFAGAGYDVEIAGRKTALTPAELAKKSQVLIITVPIAATRNVIEEIGGHLSSDALLMDLTSLKKDPVDAMLEFSPAEVIGTHPLFGPREKLLKGKNIVLCPARGQNWLPWLEDLFTKHGAHLETMSPDEHDRAMGFVQGLLHTANMAMGMAMRDSTFSFSKFNGLSTPNFKKKVRQVQRLFRQEPDLYAQMFFHNPYVLPAVHIYLEKFASIVDAVKSKNSEAIKQVFAEVDHYFSQN